MPASGTILNLPAENHYKPGPPATVSTPAYRSSMQGGSSHPAGIERADRDGEGAGQNNLGLRDLPWMRRTIAGLEATLRGELIGPDHAGVRIGPPGLQRHDRQAPVHDRPLRRCRGRDHGGELRPGQRLAPGRFAAAGTTAAGLGTCDDGVVLDLSRHEGRASRSRHAHGAGRGRLHAGRGGPRRFRLRAGGSGGRRLDHRHRRPDPRRRARLSDAQVRPDHRQPPGGGRRARRRPARDRFRPTRTRTSSGPSEAAAAISASSPVSCSKPIRSAQ